MVETMSDKQLLIEQNINDYLITLINHHDSGLGLRIKAGSINANDDTSLAILSVSDKNNDNKFIVKADGHAVSYYTHTIGKVFIESNTISTTDESPVEFKQPVTLPRYLKKSLPKLSHEYASSIVSIEDENFKPAYFDGAVWRYFNNDEEVK